LPTGIFDQEEIAAGGRPAPGLSRRPESQDTDFTDESTCAARRGAVGTRVARHASSNPAPLDAERQPDHAAPERPMLLESSPATLKHVPAAAHGAASMDHGTEAALARARELRVDIAGLRAVVQSLERAADIAEAAIAAGVNVEDVLRRMRALALQAADPTLRASERVALDMAFAALLAEMPNLVVSAERHGVNLLGHNNPGLEALIDDETGECVRIAGEDCSLGGPNVLVSAENDLADIQNARMTGGLAGLSLANVERAMAGLMLGARKLSAHGTLVRRLADSLRDTLDIEGRPSTDDGRRLRALAEAQRQLGRLEATGAAATLLALFR
jgi:flagellin